jgi:hypothetical protein
METVPALMKGTTRTRYLRVPAVFHPNYLENNRDTSIDMLHLFLRDWVGARDFPWASLHVNYLVDNGSTSIDMLCLFSQGQMVLRTFHGCPHIY